MIVGLLTLWKCPDSWVESLESELENWWFDPRMNFMKAKEFLMKRKECSGASKATHFRLTGSDHWFGSHSTSKLEIRVRNSISPWWFLRSSDLSTSPHSWVTLKTIWWWFNFRKQVSNFLEKWIHTKNKHHQCQRGGALVSTCFSINVGPGVADYWQLPVTGICYHGPKRRVKLGVGSQLWIHGQVNDSELRSRNFAGLAKVVWIKWRCRTFGTIYFRWLTLQSPSGWSPLRSPLERTGTCSLSCRKHSWAVKEQFTLQSKHILFCL